MIASVQPSMDASSNSSARRRCCLGGGIGGGLLIAQAPGCSVCSSFRQVRNCSRHIGVVDQLEAAFTAGLAGRGVRSVFGICGEGLDCFRRWKLRSAIKVVSRGLPSSFFTFPLRDRYLPPCLCTMSCTEAAYAGTHPSSVTLMSASRRGVRAENAPIVEGADLVLDLGGVNLNDITTAAYSGHLDLSRFITVGLDDVRIGDQVIANVRLADVLSELAKLKPSSAPYRGTPQALAPVNGSASDKITMAA